MLRRTGIKPVLLEASEDIGGISRTIRYKKNLMDIERMDFRGHRFFSKSDRVMQSWMELMPPDIRNEAAEIAYQGKKRAVALPARLQEESPLRGMGPKRAGGQAGGDRHRHGGDGRRLHRACRGAWAHGDDGGGDSTGGVAGSIPVTERAREPCV